MSNITPLLISREEAAKLLGGISLRHLDRLCAKGELTKRRVGARAMIVHTSVASYIEPAPAVALVSQFEFPLPEQDPFHVDRSLPGKRSAA
jgi:hypothetical protein